MQAARAVQRGGNADFTLCAEIEHLVGDDRQIGRRDERQILGLSQLAICGLRRQHHMLTRPFTAARISTVVGLCFHPKVRVTKALAFQMGGHAGQQTRNDELGSENKIYLWAKSLDA